MAERRELTFADLDEMLAEVDRLLAGHVTVGRWSLGQICSHLRIGFALLRRGRPEADPGPAPEAASRPSPEALRKRFFRVGRFPDGVEAPLPVLLPRPDLDDREEAEALREAVAFYLASPGPFPAHPVLGPMSKDDWTRFHCMHAAHHLGFAVPC